MSWAEESPLAAALAGAAGYLGGRQAKEQTEYERKRQAEIDRQQTAYQSAQLAAEQERQKFEESLYAPGQYRTISTTGKYQQGPMKGKPKVMTRQELIPGTEGPERLKAEAEAGYYKAHGQELTTQGQLNLAKIPVQQALAVYWRSRPGQIAKAEYDKNQREIESINARIQIARSRPGAGGAMTPYQIATLNARLLGLNQANQRIENQAQQFAQNQAAAAAVTSQQPYPAYQPSPNQQTIYIINPATGAITAQPAGGASQTIRDGDPAPAGAKPGREWTNPDGSKLVVGPDGKMHKAQVAKPSSGWGTF